MGKNVNYTILNRSAHYIAQANQTTKKIIKIYSKLKTLKGQNGKVYYMIQSQMSWLTPYSIIQINNKIP